MHAWGSSREETSLTLSRTGPDVDRPRGCTLPNPEARAGRRGGGPTVTGPGGSLSGRRLGGRRAHIVLVALALEGGTLSGDRLADLVWEGGPPPTWPAALRGVIGGLRAVLRGIGIDEQALLMTVPGGYRLAPDTAVDVREAEKVLDRAQDMDRHGRPRAALDLLAPLGPWRGADVLPGVDAEWLQVHRERVDALARRTWDLVVEAATGSGEHRQAVAAAEQWVAAAPLDERAHRALIGALDGAGDRAGAVRAYEACRARLADELGVDPTRETVEVYLRALGDQRSLPHAPVPQAATSFHGRDKERRAVTERLRDPACSRSSARPVSGSPGSPPRSCSAFAARPVVRSGGCRSRW